MTPPRQTSQAPSHSTAVVGLQWGDEGKGKVVDLLAPDHDAVVRYNGGANAGHSVVVAGERFALHLVPSGILSPGAASVIANGVVLDPEQLLKELATLAERGVDVSGVAVSDRAHVVMPYHKAEDAAREAVLAEADSGSIGTTGRGIGPAYADKVQRGAAVRVCDLLRPQVLRNRVETAIALKRPLLDSSDADLTDCCDSDAVVARASAWGEQLRPMIRDTTTQLQEMSAQGKRILFEGANATLLDIDHGTFPFVTSSSPSTLGIWPGTGLAPIEGLRVVGIAKAYQTRVGAGPMPTELIDDAGERIRQRGREFGTTTGRPRRCGWLDLVALRYAARINGCTELAVMLLDVLAGFETLRVCTAYERDGERFDFFPPDSEAIAGVRPVYERMPGFAEEVSGVSEIGALPSAARAYVDRIEEFVQVPVTLISVGPDRAQTIRRDRGAGVGA